MHEGEKKREPNPVFKEVWSSLWPQIASRKDQWIDLRAIFGKQAPTHQHLYYSPQEDAAVVFNSNIIPFDGSFPCQHGGKASEYFVAATTPHAAVPEQKRDACSTATFLDSTQVPFFVLPGGVFGQLKVGDVAIGWSLIDGTERLVYGVVGDTGPEDQIGEGSILFTRRLRGVTEEPRNAGDVEGLDIKVEEHSGGITSLAVLVLGGTARDVGTDFSNRNIERVAKLAFAKWASGRQDRLRSCVNAAPPNPLQGTETTAPN